MIEDPMDPHAPPLRAIAFTSDLELLDRLRLILEEAPQPVLIEDAITVPLRQVSRMRLAKMEGPAPDLIFLDLAEEPEIGISFAQYLSDTYPAVTVIGLGPTLSPDLLIAAMQADVSKFLEVPLQPDAVFQLLSRVNRPGQATAATPATTHHHGRVIHVFSPKGGSGTTTLSVNLAIALHRETGRRSLILDLDPELGDTALLLGVEPRFSIVDLVKSLGRLDGSLLDSYVTKHESGVHLLSAPLDPTEVGQLSTREITSIFEFLRGHYDWLIVDAPKSLVPTTMASLEIADEVILLSLVDLPSLKKATRCQVFLRRFFARPSEKWLKLVVNRYDPDDVISLEEVERTLGLKVYHTLRNDYASVIHSINTGEPVVGRRSSPFAQDLQKLARKIAAGEGEGGEAVGAPGTLFQRAVRSSLRTLRST